MASVKQDEPERIRVRRRDVERGRLPWRVKFKAWWDGLDVQLPSTKKAKEKKKGHNVRAPDPNKPWSEPRIDLVQQVWGEGFDRPGGADLIVELVKPLGLDSSMTVLDIGAGLGGGTRAICSAFDVWITGLEQDADLAQVGQELSNIAGMGKKAPIYQEDFENLELKERGYDCIFSHETFFQVHNKSDLLHMIDHGLKPGGHLVFTDYLLADVRSDSQDIQAWRERETLMPHLWNVNDYRDVLKELKLDIRISENITPRIISAIKKGWAKYMEQAKNQGSVENQGDLVMREAELWMRRLKVLESGQVKMYRFHALKKSEGKLLSDW
jgi:cyclopropane fatty-acyl-phospholipid synthase-like methyltransferase